MCLKRLGNLLKLASIRQTFHCAISFGSRTNSDSRSVLGIDFDIGVNDDEERI